MWLLMVVSVNMLAPWCGANPGGSTACRGYWNHPASRYRVQGSASLTVMPTLKQRMEQIKTFVELREIERPKIPLGALFLSFVIEIVSTNCGWYYYLQLYGLWDHQLQCCLWLAGSIVNYAELPDWPEWLFWSKDMVEWLVLAPVLLHWVFQKWNV